MPHWAGLQVKLWDTTGGQPSLLASEDTGVGAVFTAAFCGECGWLVATGGAKGTVAVWDVTTSAAVRARFGKQLAAARTRGSMEDVAQV